jgi:hypothetical protein
MSQHDLNIANQGFPAFRADLNDALVALGSTNSGATAPATTFANQLWYDTANNILKIRNEDNDAWISIATLDQSGDLVSAIGSTTLANLVTLAGTETLTNKTLTSPAINGQTVDNITDTQGGVFTPSSAVMRNRIINGDMRIDQRNAGASITPADGQYTLDRYIVFRAQANKFSVQQNAGAVTPPNGFTNYLGVTSLAATSLATGDYYMISQRIEGFNIADLGWGTANAKPVTLSFWVRSSLTGTFGGSFMNGGQNRAYPFTYTISSSNTWEQKSITLAGDTSGTWATNNSEGIGLYFGLGMGATFSGTAGSWQAGTFYSATGATSVVGTNGATLYITGVQLEKGTQATSFEYRQYGTELALCQRYFESNFPIGTAPANGVSLSDRVATVIFFNQSAGLQYTYKVQKRANATITFYSGSNNTSVNGQPCVYIGTTWTTVPSPSISGSSNTYEFGIQTGAVSGSTNGSGVIGQFPWTASAEL